ncbi:phage head spike fiber domain-containing protein [Aeromonas taiwanensis]|uniref:phage head spike fiber domain-containing protein n=1 Tax=Aeromonas taiwanensis TaxID=633417 RepID=UPI003BA3C28F
MAGVWKRDGTVAVTNGNKKVTGTGTTFADTRNGVAKGHLFCITSGTSVDFYEVDYVVSNTELYLVQAYRGTTATGKAYEIITTFSDSVPEFARRLTATLSAYQQQGDAFQALLTSSAATIEVTAPDGTKQTLIPWNRVTSEGEGQAARAKTEADKAAASAALAGDIVAASALPLPDVWAPLSDSLRLITGYGRDVLVGSDVVARMVNFSRNSTATYTGKDGLPKTAAANEPRFEKEGLLVEGQSQNIIPISNFPQNLAGWSTPNSTGNVYSYVAAPDGTSSAVKVSFVGDGFNQPFPSLVVGTVYTFSFYAKNETATDVNLTIRLGTGDVGATVRIPANTAWTRYSVTRTFQAGDSTLRWYFSTKNVEVSLWGTQLEALPFASSYIPTAGAAVTRAKDILYLAPSGNVPFDVNMAFAAQIRLMGKGLQSWPRVFEISDTANKGPFFDMATGVWGGVNLVGVRRTVAARFGDTSRWLDGVNIGQAWQAYPVKTYSEPVYIAGSNVAGSRDFYGHIRNLRAWFFSPTDDQMKAIR